MTETEIKDLINDVALTGSRASFKKLYLFYYAKLFWFAKSIVKFDEAAEEIVDDVFLNLWAQRATLTNINCFASYCYISIKNKSITHISKKQLNKISLDNITIEIVDGAATGEDRLICKDTSGIINNALSKLSTQSKTVFKLVKEDGLKYREVADLLDISVKTVEYHMGNALRQIATAVSNSQKTLSTSAVLS